MKNPANRNTVARTGAPPRGAPTRTSPPLGALALFALAPAVLSPMPLQAGSVLFDPSATSVEVGAAFSVDIIGQGFAESVDGGGLSFSFDAALLQVTGVSVDTTTWDFLNDPGTIDNATGLVSEIQFGALFSAVTGNFPIATVAFQALAAGVTSLGLSASTLNPFASDGEPILVEMLDGSVDVAAAPAPAVPLLLLTGLAAAARLHRGATA